jgi:hypothetical protein
MLHPQGYITRPYPLEDICHKSRDDQKLGFLEIRERERALVLQGSSIGYLARFK